MLRATGVSPSPSRPWQAAQMMSKLWRPFSIIQGVIGIGMRSIGGGITLPGATCPGGVSSSSCGGREVSPVTTATGTELPLARNCSPPAGAA